MRTSCSNKEKLFCCAEADCSDRNKRINIYYFSPQNQKNFIDVFMENYTSMHLSAITTGF